MTKVQKHQKIFRSVFCLFAILTVFAGISGCKEAPAQKKLVMATEATFPPYEFRNGTRIEGIDPDIIREIASRNGYELHIEDINFDSIIVAIQTRKADVAASGITVTNERKQMVNFTIPYV